MTDAVAAAPEAVPGHLDPQIPTIVRQQAWHVVRRFYRVIDVQEAEQESWLWVFGNPDEIDRIYAEAGDDIEKGRAHLAVALRRQAWKVVRRYARQDPKTFDLLSDQFFFNREALERVLPDYLAFQSNSLPRQWVDSSMPGGNGDPAIADNHPLGAWDVQKAYEQLELRLRRIVWRRYVAEQTLVEIGELEGVSNQRISQLVDQALHAMLTTLNGGIPYEHPDLEG